VETSLNDLALALLRVMGSDLKPQYGPARKVNPVPRRLADTRAAAKALGFRAQVGLDEGLRRLVAWWAASSAQLDHASAAARPRLATVPQLVGRVIA
jgi:UDP-glucose 4-epimerase